MANVTLIDGHVPNYVDPETKVPRFLGVQTALTMLALIVVALRVYTRKFIHNIFSTEDWVAVGSMTLATVESTVSCLGVLGGTGLHYYDIPPTTNKSIASLTSFINQVLYQPTLQLTKISILLFYMASLGKTMKIPCTTLITLSILTCIACTVVEFTQCTPTEMLWTGVRPEGYKCINQVQFFRVTGVINLILDVVTLAAPLPVLWKLNAPLRTRLVLCGVFSVGLVAIVADIARVVIWYQTDDGNRQSKDSSWNRVTIVNWSCVEYCSGIICASLPHLKALIVAISPKFFDSIMSTSKGGSRAYAANSALGHTGVARTDGKSSNNYHMKALSPGGHVYGNTSHISRSDRKTATHLTDDDSDEFILDPVHAGGIMYTKHVSVSTSPV